jgi:hypothetical protein
MLSFAGFTEKDLRTVARKLLDVLGKS